MASTSDAFRTPFKAHNTSGIPSPSIPNPKKSRVDEFLSLHPGNHTAYDKDIPVVEGLIDGVNNEIGLYDLDMVMVRNVLAELRARRDALSQTRARLEAMIRPSIRRLPTEILMDIFRITCEDNHKGTMPVLRLGGVCRRWRSITHASPALWSNINCRKLYGMSHRDFGNLTRYCLDRSEQVPLSVSFGHWGALRGKYRMAGFTELIKQSHRWKTLSFDDFFPQSPAFPTTLPILEELTISTQNWSFPLDLPNKVATPTLRTLRFHCAGGALKMAARFDMASLTCLSLSGATFRAPLLALLRQCPKLTVLDMEWLDLASGSELEAFHYTNEVDNRLPPVSLPIKSLTLPRHLKSYSLSILFASLSFPFLEHLSAYGDGRLYHRDFISSDMMPTVRHSTGSSLPPLASLALEQFRFDDGDSVLKDLSRLSNTLTCLSLASVERQRSHWTEVLLRILLPDDPTFLPHLKELELDCHMWRFHEDPRIYAMIESRWQVEERAMGEKSPNVEKWCYRRIEVAHDDFV
ncbi:hypothetical protein V5O48_002148 [Marasmius crinis-equi]|uniref:F-box domain-containing protein n=1 Tax=Marasmius crinis-equi TaxID=585013 RepID=A0ABR3FWE7_9AGAR